MRRIVPSPARALLRVLSGALSLVILSGIGAPTVLQARGYDDAPEATKRAMGIYFISNVGIAVCDKSAVVSGSASVGSTPPGGAATLPPDLVATVTKLKDKYVAGGLKWNIPWQLLAAVHHMEASSSPNHDLQAGNPIPGGGGQYTDDYHYIGGPPKTLEDSIDAAAQGLIARGKTNIAAQHGGVTGTNPDPIAVKDTLFSYNGRNKGYAANAAKYTDPATGKPFDPATQPYEGSPYVMNKADAQRDKMPKVGGDFGGIDTVETRYGGYVVYAALMGISPGSGSQCGGSSGANGAVGTEGWAFPVNTTKTVIKGGAKMGGETLVWCFAATKNCHHDYNAADIHAPTDTPIVSITDGKIVHTEDHTITIKSNNSKSPNQYIVFYQHLLGGSILVKEGDTVTAGQPLAKVGTVADAFGTAPHLHIDFQPSPPATLRPNCASAECSTGAFDFVDIQPLLLEAYKTLPE